MEVSTKSRKLRKVWRVKSHSKDIDVNLLLFKLVFMHGVSTPDELSTLMFVDKIITRECLAVKLKEMGLVVKRDTDLCVHIIIWYWLGFKLKENVFNTYTRTGSWINYNAGNTVKEVVTWRTTDGLAKMISINNEYERRREEYLDDKPHGLFRYEDKNDKEGKMNISGYYENGKRRGWFYLKRYEEIELQKYYQGGILYRRGVFEYKTGKLLQSEDVRDLEYGNYLADPQDLIDQYLP